MNARLASGFRSPGSAIAASWRALPPISHEARFTQLGPTFDSASGAGGRLHPLPLDQPRGCRRVPRSITMIHLRQCTALWIS